jgi:5-methylthioribose kinase
MAVLLDAIRKEIWSDFMEECSSLWEKLDLNKNEIKAAVDATDQWLEDNDISYNNALPAAAKNNLNKKQKARLLMKVIRLRYEVT